jgi:hypothetical protein
MNQSAQSCAEKTLPFPSADCKLGASVRGERILRKLALFGGRCGLLGLIAAFLVQRLRGRDILHNKQKINEGVHLA